MGVELGLTAAEWMLAAEATDATLLASGYAAETASLAAASAAGAGVGSALMTNTGQAAGTALATGLVGKALAPKAPGEKQPIGMPDPLAQEAARQKAIQEQIQRRGRASTIMTQPSGDKLGN